MRSDWSQVRLADLIEINPSRKEKNWPLDYIDYVDISSVSEGSISAPAVRMSTQVAPSRAQRLIQGGDTVLSTVRPNRRSMFYAKHPANSTVVSTGFAVLRPKPDLIDPRFLYALVYDQEFTEYLISREQGAAYPAISPADIGEAQVNLPPLAEQKRIGEILGALDDKIELNRRMAATLEEMARAIFKSWFIDFDPVHAKAEGRPTGLPPEIDALFPDSFQDSPLGPIPTGWTIGTIDGEFTVTMGQSPPGSSYNESGNGLPFYQGNADFGIRFPSVRVFCSQPSRLAKAGDTLVSVRAPVGAINVAVSECSIGRGLCAIRHPLDLPSYTYNFIDSMKHILTQFDSEGTVFGCISKKNFANMKCLAPSPGVASAFELASASIGERLCMLNKQNLDLVAMRDALIHPLISGQLLTSKQTGVACA